MNIPEYFYKLHNFVNLTAYIMFINGNGFMITPERKLKFITVDQIPSQTADQISKRLNRVVKLYGGGGFIIHVILMDMEFDKVAEIMGNIEVNIEVERENMGEVERKNRTLKESRIGIVNTLPHSYLLS